MLQVVNDQGRKLRRQAHDSRHVLHPATPWTDSAPSSLEQTRSSVAISLSRRDGGAAEIQSRREPHFNLLLPRTVAQPLTAPPPGLRLRRTPRHGDEIHRTDRCKKTKS
jgi:hypothetical protein